MGIFSDRDIGGFPEYWSETTLGATSRGHHIIYFVEFVVMCFRDGGSKCDDIIGRLEAVAGSDVTSVTSGVTYCTGVEELPLT